MFKKYIAILIILTLGVEYLCANSHTNKNLVQRKIMTGADNISAYLPLLRGATIGIVTNHTGIVREFDSNNELVSQTHLVDFLIGQNINIKAIFAPEHGFRGIGDAGEQIKDGRDVKSGLPIFSLHGKNRKPQPDQLKGISTVVFDIQDVGARFYTYISTLHYVMEACAENNIALIVLDRPNPNGHYVDGPVMEDKYKSFIGMHNVPVVYGMTIGEYAMMINGERWLSRGLRCNLNVIPLQNWTHQTMYSLKTRPSPNLPNDRAIALYPSICFFEQTNVSVGRGTLFPFQVYGSNNLDSTVFIFKFCPQSMIGAKYPKHKGEVCFGEDLRQAHIRLDRIHLNWIIKAYNNTKNKNNFFKPHFEYLTGTMEFRKQIEDGKSEKMIRNSWKPGIDKFKKIRKKYLLYSDF